MNSPDSQSIQCPKCKATNPSGKSFCSDCGCGLDPVIGTIIAYLDSNLKSQIDEVIKDRFGPQPVTETALASSVAEKLLGWAKLLGLAVGLPLTLMGIYLGFLGIDSKNSIKTIDASIETTKQQIRSSDSDVKVLMGDLKSSKGALDEVKPTVASVAKQIAGVCRTIANLARYRAKSGSTERSS